MTKRKRCAGSAAPAMMLAVLLVILVAITVYLFVAKVFAPPPAITAVGHEIDRQYKLTLMVTGLVFVAAQLGLALVVVRSRDRGQQAHFTRGSHVLEILWTSATVVLFVGLGLMAAHAWAEVHFTQAAPGAIQIEATGEQFQWNFRYPGPDGKFGRSLPALYNDSGGNPLGLDPSDPHAKDDVVSPVMAVPVNHEIALTLKTKDVIHSFFVRELRIKQDAVPGMIIPLHFTPTQIGTYEIVCSQLCGLGHYRMRSFLQVMSDADYENFLKQNAPGQ